jgi:hypothetical protein
MKVTNRTLLYPAHLRSIILMFTITHFAYVPIHSPEKEKEQISRCNLEASPRRLVSAGRRRQGVKFY